MTHDFAENDIDGVEIEAVDAHSTVSIPHQQSGSWNLEIAAESNATFERFPAPIKLLCKPWTSLSKRARALLVVGLTLILLSLLITAIVLPASSSSTRIYYIAAEKVSWNYAPFGKNFIRGSSFNSQEAIFVEPSHQTIGSTYYKARYLSYTNESFSVKSASPDNSHVGLLGPVIRAEVGDTIVVHFKNNLDFPVSLHANGVMYTKENEGIQYASQIPTVVEEEGEKDNQNDNQNRVERDSNTNSSSGYVKPGDIFVYHWTVPESAGPTSNEFSSVAWAYFSSVDPISDFNSGLIGPIVITKKGAFDSSSGRPDGVASECFILPATFDENKSHYFVENVQNAPNLNVSMSDPIFVNSNIKNSVNGYLFGNLPNLRVRHNENIRWYVLGFGQKSHTLFWSGQTTVVQSGERSSSIFAYSGAEITADMQPTDPGTWLLAALGEEATFGMAALWEVI